MFDIKKIDSEEFLQILDKREQYQIVDINEEQDNFCYQLKIKHIPFSELEEHIPILDKNKPLLLICRFGERSFFGATILKNEHGFTNVISLTGGTKNLAELMENENENVNSK
ncbi:MAG: rhodanese-like domain-containing protein [Bacteroidales bacterium]|nr:rhodanese-like domain-containing protein [Bacteroidales bacterium]MCF8455282.1 rhodanese-like domain-containing protein [Bacteroidales bacterium]